MEFKYYSFKLSGIMLLVFLAQVIFNGFTDIFLLNQSSWIQAWRFLTSIFLHGGIAHLLLNLFALVLFGSILERLIGSKRFLLVFFITGIFANLISVNFYSSSLGASGAIFGIIGALVVIRPMMPIWAFGMPLPMFVAGIFWAAADILGAVGFFAGNPIDNTGNIAHLSGMFFGLFFGFLYKKKRKRRIGISLSEPHMRAWEDRYLK